MIRFFTKHPTAANLLMLIFLLMGFLTLSKLKRETFPDYTSTEVEIRIVYPGATAKEVEEAVCQRVEDALDSVRNIKELRADAREGIAIIVVEMEETGDAQGFVNEVETEVKAIDNFPDSVEEPVIRQLHLTDPVLSVLVSGPMSVPDLKAYTEDLKARMQRLPEVSLVKVQGFSDHQFRVELSAQALLRFDLSVNDVADKIRQQSLDLPAGTIETRESDILVRFVEQRRAPEQLEELVIVATRSGGEIKLGDLGKVVDLFELDEDRIELGNQRAALLSVQKTKAQDSIRIARMVKDFLQEERECHPQIKLEVTQDTSVLVQGRLDLLLTNGWQGMILVFLAMWMFFNVRLAFWVVMSLPVSFLGAFYFLPMMGLTINMMTMVGMLLALGLLMDDGIVIAENIATHRARGASGMNAAIHGVSEVASGVLSPLAFLEGTIGKVLKVIPMILILVMAVSLIEAFFILPAHLAHSLPERSKRQNRFRRFFESLIEKVKENILGRGIDTLVRWRYLWVGCVVLVFLVSIGMLAGGILRFQAFPDLEGDVVVARLQLPQGTPLKRTREVVDRITKGLDRTNQHFKPDQPDQQDLVKRVYVKFNENADTQESGPHVATVFVDLLDAEIRKGRLEEIYRIWRNEIGDVPDVAALVLTEPAPGPAGRNLEVRLQGHDLGQLQEAGLKLKQWLSQFSGVYNLSEDLRPGKQEARLKIRQGAEGLGLNVRLMANQIRSAFYGVTANEVQIDRETYEIDVRFQQSDQSTLGDLENFYFVIPPGKKIPLRDVVTIEMDRGWSRINRVNRLRTLSIRGDVDPKLTNTERLIGEMRKHLIPELEKAYPGMEVDFEGEIKKSQTTQSSMKVALAIGLMGIFVLLSFQFRSYVEPLIVMVAIPLALIGVIWGHLLMGLDLSMPSILGFVSLSGVVVNDSILLVLFLKKQRQEGADLSEAARQSSRLRFRAILITSLTTIAGLTPLMFERSLQAQILIPLAVSICFGLLASTVLVLLVIPCLYVILGDLGLATRVHENHEETPQTVAAPMSPDAGGPAGGMKHGRKL